MNIPPFGSQFRKLSNLEEFRVRALEIPSNRVYINAGSFWPDNSNFVGFLGGSSPIVTFPTVANSSKFVVVCLNKSAQPVLVDGPVSTSHAQLPVIPNDLMPLSGIHVKNTTTVITDSMIYDLRPFLNFSFGVNDHLYLSNLDSDDAHPISSITGLSAALLNKVDVGTLDSTILAFNATLASTLASKSDSDGTISETFTLNKDVSGVPASDCFIEVNRGSLPNVFIRWNEASNYWEYTNDGTIWNKFDSNLALVNATDTESGIVKLSVEPEDQPIAVGDNDPRLLTEQEKTEILAALESNVTQAALDTKVDKIVGKSLSTEDFTTEYKTQLDTLVIPEEVTKSSLGLENVDNTSDLNKPISTLTQTALDTKLNAILEDKSVPGNFYRVEVDNGVLIVTLVV